MEVSEQKKQKVQEPVTEGQASGYGGGDGCQAAGFGWRSE